MKKTLTIVLGILFLCASVLFGQIVSKKKLNEDFLKNKIKGDLFNSIDFLKKVDVYDITYLSDGLKVKGFLVIPKKKGKYPCIIYNRGGNRSFGAITYSKISKIFAQVSSWGYVVIASQYRGNIGGEGIEEFGGKDVDDILNLFPIIDELPEVDSSEIGILGWSRGGMMSYLVLKRNKRVKAAVIGGGLSDLYMMKKLRPEMEDVYRELIPNYDQNKEKALFERSAIKWADKISKKTPILMLHGTADWRVSPQMALELANKFIEYRQPFRLIMFEGGDHGLTEFDEEVFLFIKNWFNKFLKQHKQLPSLVPHGS